MLKSLTLTLALIVLSATARADVLMENLTWMELSQQIATGSTTVIVPIGGTEQNGPYMALGKHNARVSFLAKLIAEKLGHTLVAPTIAYVPEGQIDPPTQHMKFPGTLTISDATFISMLQDTGKSLRHAGFKTIVFIGDHGGYQSDLTKVADSLNKQWAGKGKAVGLTKYYDLSRGPYNAFLRSAGLSNQDIGIHASGSDTSLELATAPSMVRIDKLKDQNLATPANGVYGGNAAKATAELGQKGVDLIVAGTVSAIQSVIGVQ